MAQTHVDRNINEGPWPGLKTTASLREWELPDKVNLEVVAYGWEEKRCTVRMHLPAERDKKRLHDKTRELLRDIKHTRSWQCEFCGDEARETHVMDLTWTHLTPVRMVIYMHFICDHDRPRCFAGVEEHHKMINMLNQIPPSPLMPPPPKQPGQPYPLAASCAGCRTDETAEKELLRCSACKLTRYCSAQCQRDDWKRHKPTCKQIYSVLFEGWD